MHEMKSADDLAGAFDDFMRTFEAFKSANDTRLSEIERRAADPLTAQKVDRISRALDDLSLKMSRPQVASSLAGGAQRSLPQIQHKAAFDAYVRNGETATLRDLEGKALSATSDPDGGYLVPDETERAVNASLRAISPIRAIAGVRQVSSSVFKKPFSVTGFGTGWVGETAARPETTTPTLAELAFPTMELYAMPAATSALLDDSAINVDEWIAEEVRTAFAEQEGVAFVIGNGANRPRGFLDYPKVANAAWSHGSLGFIATGAAGAFPAVSGSDKLIDLVYAVKAGYRANGTFVMNRAAQGFELDTVSAPARLYRKPQTRLIGPFRNANAIEIAFTAGYGAAPADVPAPLRHALLMLIAHWYEHREIVGETSPTPIRQLGQGVAQALQAIGGVVGTALAIYGRIRAAQPLVRRDLSIRL